MKKSRLLISVIIMTFLVIVLSSISTYATSDTIINQHTINLVISNDGTAKVNETISLSPNEDLSTYTRELPNIATLDLNEDGSKETYEIIYKDIKTRDLNSTIYTVGTDINIEIQLNDSKLVELEYTIILPKMIKNEESYFYYIPFSVEQDYLIENLSITMNFPKLLTNELTASMYDLNDTQHEGYFVTEKNENSLLITNTSEIPTHSLVKIQGSLSTNYFEYKKPTNYQIHAIVISVIYMIAVFYYIFFFKMSRSNKSKILYYPPTDIPIPYFGYVLDKEILPQDLFSQIIIWANHGNIDIIQRKSDIFINIVKPLEDATTYETELFSLLFQEATSVRLQDLKNRDIESSMKKICSHMMLHIFSNIKKPIYINVSKKYHMFYTVLSSIPMSLFAAATAFMLSGRITEVLRYFIITMIIMICSVFPLHFIIKKKGTLTKGKNGVLNILVIFWIVILWSAEIVFLAHAAVSSNLLGIIGVLSIGFIFALLYATKRTKYGKIKHHDLTYLKHYMGFVKSPHLSQLLSSNPNYFFDLLPTTYVYGNVQEWFHKFKQQRVSQPDWFYSDVSDKSWFEQLELVFQELYFATTKDH